MAFGTSTRFVLVAVLALLVTNSLASTAKKKRSLIPAEDALNNDECPRGCMNGSEALELKASVAVCQASVRKLKHLVRGQDDVGERLESGDSRAADVLSGLLRDTEQLAIKKHACSDCVKRACMEPSVTRFLTDATEVLVFDGRKAHHCKGCRCAYRELAEHTREQYVRASRQRISRAVVFSTASIAMITDHALYTPGSAKEALEGLPKAGERALARKLRHSDRSCFVEDESWSAEGNGTNSTSAMPSEYAQGDSTISEYRFGLGAIRTYMAEMNADGSMGRLTVYVYRHE